MDDQRCTGRTTRLILRALYELLELPAGTRRELVIVTTLPWGGWDGWGERVGNALQAMIPHMKVVEYLPRGARFRAHLDSQPDRDLELTVRFATVGTDLRGTCPTVICIDHEAEERLDAMPNGWGLIQLSGWRVVVRQGVTAHSFPVVVLPACSTGPIDPSSSDLCPHTRVFSCLA